MKITIASKKLSNKPKRGTVEMNSYLKELPFTTYNVSDYSYIDTFKTIIRKGYTLAYLYNDKSFKRVKGYMTNNYVGTQYIIVDIDACDEKIEDLYNRIEIKPTIYHTTFSNLTESKDNKYCYHLIYCFDNVIYGERDFERVLNYITRDYADLVDKQARDCHRLIFTSNSTLDNFQDFYDGAVLNRDSILSLLDEDEEEEDIIFEEQSEVIERKKIEQDEKFTLDEDFFEDFNTLPRLDFINKYIMIYPIVRKTKVTYNDKHFANLNGVEYYEVFNKSYWSNSEGKYIVNLVGDGYRSSMLIKDTISFMYITPNIPREQLLLSVVNEVSYYYDNSDGHVTNRKIYDAVKYVYENISRYEYQGKRKSFKIDMKYYLHQGLTVQQATAIVKRCIKDEEIGNNLDLDATIEENLQYFKDQHIPLKKERLLDFLDRYQIEMVSTKERRNNFILDLHRQHPTMSSREIERICKDNGYNVCFKTVTNIINQ